MDVVFTDDTDCLFVHVRALLLQLVSFIVLSLFSS